MKWKRFFEIVDTVNFLMCCIITLGLLPLLLFISYIVNEDEETIYNTFFKKGRFEE